jgi:hypothetical protein
MTVQRYNKFLIYANKSEEKYRKEERKVPKARRERNCEEMREGELRGRRSVIKR